ncbi:MAG: glycerophosphodiester phosphodiesterase [Candidatus Peregrinibacteria bacterium]
MNQTTQSKSNTDDPDKENLSAKPQPAQSDILSEERAGLKAKVDVSRETHEELEKSRITGFFEGIFGKNRVSKFLAGVTGFIASKLGLGKKEIPWKEFEKKIDSERSSAEGGPLDIEKYIVAHRALGYGRHKQNSLSAILSAIDGGEDQLEIDLRRGTDGKIYLSHDPIENEKNPSGKLTAVREALEAAASNKEQDVAFFLDVKEKGIMEEVDNMIAEIDAKNSGREGYIPLAKRNIVMSFDPEILKNAHEKNSDRPLMFSYFPVAKLQTASEAKSQGNIFGILKRRDLKKICGSIDSLTGGHLEKDFEGFSVKVGGKKMSDDKEENKSAIHIESELPDEKILKMIRESNGYICVPFTLVTPDIIKHAHESRVKVAVWGAEGIEIQQAIVNQVDLIISDKPDVIKS